MGKLCVNRRDNLAPATKELIEQHVVRNFKTGCWEWIGAKTSRGYGEIQHNGRQMLTHRVVYMLWIGEVKTGMDVCHCCDNPICVNPNHLFIGTHSDNMKDAIRKGRIPNGANHKMSKLKECDIVDIRASSLNQPAIARRYGVTQSLVSQIRMRKIWANVK